VEKVRLLLSVSNDVVSIDAPVRDAEESSLRDLLRSSASPDPEQILAEREERLQIDAVVNELGGVTTEVIRLRFGIGKPEELTLQEIGDMKGRTRERIRQIESKGLRSLRRKSGALRHFWDEARGTKKKRESPPVLNKTERDDKVAQRTHGTGGDGVLALLFDRLSSRAREVLILRYGLDGGDGISEEAAATRLEVDLDAFRLIQSQALEVLGHTGASFEELLRSNAAIRASLSLPARRDGDERGVPARISWPSPAALAVSCAFLLHLPIPKLARKHHFSDPKPRLEHRRLFRGRPLCDAVLWLFCETNPRFS
jgi:DNA-directed RNA polymerase specialized sigma24 family protein